MLIRKAERRDFDELLEIYNYEVLNGVATFSIRPRTEKEWEEWFSAHNVGNHPLIVAEIDGKVAGYASLSQFREREAFDPTVELSVYVSPFFRRMGVATKLMQNILEEAKRDDSIHLVVSLITGENEVSKKLHEKFGFIHCGFLPEVGYKMERYIGLDYYYLKA